MTWPREGEPAPTDEVIGEVTDMIRGEYFVLVTEWPDADLDVAVWPVRDGGTQLFNTRVTVADADACASARARLRKIGWDVVGDWAEVGSGWKAPVRRIP